jgi:pyruvate kinase
VLIGASPFDDTVHKLSLVWGTKPLKMDQYGTTDEMVWHAVEKSVQAGYIKAGHLVAVLAGAADGAGTTDVLRVVRVA